MVLHLTDAEAYALSQKLQAEPSGFGEEEPVTIDLEALESAKLKLKSAMKKADATLTRTLDNAISSLTASGFDSDQIDALSSANSKASEHNSKKYADKK